MRIDSFGDSFEAVAENQLRNGPIRVCRVQHTRKRVPGLMRAVLHVKVLHHGVKDGTTKAIV